MTRTKLRAAICALAGAFWLCLLPAQPSSADDVAAAVGPAESYVYLSEILHAEVLADPTGGPVALEAPLVQPGAVLRRLLPEERDRLDRAGWVVDIAVGLDGRVLGLVVQADGPDGTGWREVLLRPEDYEVVADASDPDWLAVVARVTRDAMAAAPEVGRLYRERPPPAMAAANGSANGTDFAVRASRTFAGPGEYPPEEFAGYGIVAFNLRPDAERGRVFCEAFRQALLTDEELEAAGVPIEHQMVTVWPVASRETAETARADGSDACTAAVADYNFAAATFAIEEANRTAPDAPLTGPGPFLLAWSPGRTKGEADALVLAVDLSGVRTLEQARVEFLAWRDQIQRNPELWSPGGWSLETVRLTIQRWADRRADTILSLLGIDV
jgi:hypothetical protein